MTAVPTVVNIAFWILMALEVVHVAKVGGYLITNDFARFADEFNRGWIENGGAEAPVLLVVTNFFASPSLPSRISWPFRGDGDSRAARREMGPGSHDHQRRNRPPGFVPR